MIIGIYLYRNILGRNIPYSYLNSSRHSVREIKTERKIIRAKYKFEIPIHQSLRRDYGEDNGGFSNFKLLLVI